MCGQTGTDELTPCAAVAVSPTGSLDLEQLNVLNCRPISAFESQVMQGDLALQNGERERE